MSIDRCGNWLIVKNWRKYDTTMINFYRRSEKNPTLSRSKMNAEFVYKLMNI